MLNRLSFTFGAAVVGLTTIVSAQQSPAPDFVADFTFTGSQLAGWQPVGQANWQAANGVITGNAGNGAGWLIFDRAYQDVGFFTRFRCQGACDAGVVLRAEKTPSGMKGIFVSLKPGDVAPYKVTIDAAGRILTRDLARNTEGARAGGAGGGRGGARGGGGAAGPAPTISAVMAAANAALTAPVNIEAGQWNSIEVLIDAAAISNHLNNVRNAVQGGTTGETSEFGYGSVGLYVASGSVEFNGVSVKDLSLTVEPAEQTSSRFRVQRLNDFYYAWGADVADIDRDGTLDIISGGFYYLGPNYTSKREFYTTKTYSPGEEYVLDMMTYANDFTGDGWPDIVLPERRPLVMYVNPQGQNRRWQRVEVLPMVSGETAVKGDVDGDGQPEIVFVANDNTVAYGKPNRTNPIGPWDVRKISEPVGGTHGIGIGDINGDGRMDIVHARGWWEQPASPTADGRWIYHAANFGRYTRPAQHPGGAEIAVYDFNGDKLPDIVSSLSAHGWGLAWYEQKRAADGAISFTEHMIMGDFSTKNAGNVTFSQLHSGATLIDVDRDGVMDFVTGKRHWSHLDSYTDPDPYGPAVVYWYRTVRTPKAPGGVEFVPELIHNRSGVGSEVKVVDINRDGASDIVTSGTKGTFVFWGVPVKR